jgi:hypothetical protein
MTVLYTKYWTAQLWDRLFPIVIYGDQYDVMGVFKYLKTLPQDDNIVKMINRECIIRLSSYGIDSNFVY